MDTGIKLSRCRLLASAGNGLGLMALLSPTVASLLETVQTAGRSVEHLSPVEAATNEEYWNMIGAGIRYLAKRPQQRLDEPKPKNDCRGFFSLLDEQA